MYLRQSTASQEILLGRFVDAADGDTEEISLTINNTDIKIFKQGATTLASKNSGGATHIANAMYYAVLDATDTDTLGQLEVHVHVSGARPVSRTYTVLPANVFDSLVLGTDLLQADIQQVAGTAVDANDDDVLLTGTAQAGASNTITLAAGASSTTDLYKYLTISLTSGTGAPQGNRIITGYNGTTKVATVYPAWASGATPSTDTTYVISSGGGMVAADVAASVWNALRADYALSNSFGQGIASVRGNVTGTVAGIADDGISATSFVPNAITSTVLAADCIGADQLAATAVDEIWDEAMTELSAVPAVTASLRDALRWLFVLSRNKITQTATQQLVRNNDDNTTIATSTLSDDSTTFIRGKFL